MMVGRPLEGDVRRAREANARPGGSARRGTDSRRRFLERLVCVAGGRDRRHGRARRVRPLRDRAGLLRPFAADRGRGSPLTAFLSRRAARSRCWLWACLPSRGSRRTGSDHVGYDRRQCHAAHPGSAGEARLHRRAGAGERSPPRRSRPIRSGRPASTNWFGSVRRQSAKGRLRPLARRRSRRFSSSTSRHTAWISARRRRFTASSLSSPTRAWRS